MASPTTDRRLGLVGNTAIKAPVACVATTNIVLYGEQLVDGVMTSSSRVLVAGQTDATKNGLWDSSSAAWTRCLDANGIYDLTSGTMVAVTGGTLHSGQVYSLTTPNPISVDTTDLSFSPSLTPAFMDALTVPSGAGLVGHSWSIDYDDDTSGQHIQDAQGAINVMRAVPKALRAAIRAYVSLADASPYLQSVMSVASAWLPEGGFRTGSMLTTDRGLRGASARASKIFPLNNTIDGLRINDTAGDFQQYSDFSVIFPSKGIGCGVVLANNNNNVEISRINVQYADIAFNAKFVAFMQRYQQCRADFSNTGFFADGRNSGGGGAGTTIIYDQCYGSNGVSVGWNLNYLRTVEMIQPTMDMGVGSTNAIVATGVGHLNIFGHHFEGTPTVDGSYIKYSTSGNLSHGITVIGGAIEAADLSARTYTYINVQANDDDVKVILINCNVRNLTGGANAKLAKISGAAGSKVEIIAIGCDFGALEGLLDTSAMSGTYSYRRIDNESPILASGTVMVAGGGVIDTGLANTDGIEVFAQVRTDDASIPQVDAYVVQTFSGSGNALIKFRKRTDGTSDAGTYMVSWQAIGRKI
jgi:hypothetical protein